MDLRTPCPMTVAHMVDQVTSRCFWAKILCRDPAFLASGFHFQSHISNPAIDFTRAALGTMVLVFFGLPAVRFCCSRRVDGCLCGDALGTFAHRHRHCESDRSNRDHVAFRCALFVRGGWRGSWWECGLRRHAGHGIVKHSLVPSAFRAVDVWSLFSQVGRSLEVCLVLSSQHHRCCL